MPFPKSLHREAQPTPVYFALSPRRLITSLPLSLSKGEQSHNQETFAGGQCEGEQRHDQRCPVTHESGPQQDHDFCRPQTEHVIQRAADIAKLTA